MTPNDTRPRERSRSPALWRGSLSPVARCLAERGSNRPWPGSSCYFFRLLRLNSRCALCIDVIGALMLTPGGIQNFVGRPAELVAVTVWSCGEHDAMRGAETEGWGICANAIGGFAAAITASIAPRTDWLLVITLCPPSVKHPAIPRPGIIVPPLSYRNLASICRTDVFLLTPIR